MPADYCEHKVYGMIPLVQWNRTRGIVHVEMHSFSRIYMWIMDESTAVTLRDELNRVLGEDK